ncbi:hypothetical protein ENBRE01_2729 [Enteropsectra breve]|nr:hypothetical protein ENBRE01_2729 [Enteropsectra breve]
MPHFILDNLYIPAPYPSIMSARTEIEDFLANYSPESSIDVRVLDLLQSTFDPSPVLTCVIDLLISKSINKENLEKIRKQQKLPEFRLARAFSSVDSNIYASEKQNIKKQNINEGREKCVDEGRDKCVDEVYRRKTVVIEENTKRLRDNDEDFIPGINLFEESAEADAPVIKEQEPSPVENKEATLEMRYLFPKLQCKLCGLRYTEEQVEEFGAHIEEHRRKTRLLGEKLDLKRAYFHHGEEIKVPIKLHLNIEDGAEKVVWNKSRPTCKFCKKQIKRRWRDEDESWILEDGIILNDDEVAHKDCVL